MGSRWLRFRSWMSRATPRPETWTLIGRVWRRSAWLLLIFVAASLIWNAPGIYASLGVGAILGLLLLVCLGGWLLLKLLARFPSGVRGGLLLLVVPLVPVALFSEQMLAVLYLFLALTLALIATGTVRYRSGSRISGGIFLAVGGLPLLVASAAFMTPGWETEPQLDWQPIQSVQSERLVVANPGLEGPHAVAEFSYGSGKDRHREGFGDQADWISESVDGSKLIDDWDGPHGWARTSYLGFDASELPIQGQVWMPEGDGPFPLVLIVHGNHDMVDVSDVGYDYLGRLFASRGMATVSVDENFLNGALSDLLGGPDGGLEEESDARGWVLLQHLVQWRNWARDPSHPMHSKVDLERVVLIGHSRGGEAVTEAAAFNLLPRYPDDATLTFDFGFGIRGVIAIAPVDHQYNPRDRDTALKDTNYLVIHGSHDSDVNAFVGSAMYSRLQFEACEVCFKASLYLVGANHGQFNTSWGRYDIGFPSAKLLNVTPLMDPEDQRSVAAVLFSGFLEAVLHDRPEYRPFLARPELGAHWFPKGVSYLSNYQDARQISLVDFEEDANLLSAGDNVETLSGAGLALWKEAEVPLKWRDADSAAVLLGWNGDQSEEPPVFEINLLAGGLAVAPDMTLSFSAAMGTDAPEGVDDFEVPKSLDFDIELVDMSGQVSRVALSSRRVLYPQIDPVLYKLEALAGSQASEATFQRYAFRFSEWQSANPQLNITALKTVRYLFPREVPASIWLDDVAISPDGY
jgi:dienelactone hydrolase